MSKSNTKPAKVTTTPVAKATTAKKPNHQKANETTSAPAAAKSSRVLKVKPGLKYEGARAAWYGELMKHDGKPEETFIDACIKTPPALPKSGKAERPHGWLRYFIREGVVSLS